MVVPRNPLPLPLSDPRLPLPDCRGVCRSVRSRVRRAFHSGQWAVDVAEALNNLSGEEPTDMHELSLMQAHSLSHIKQVVDSASAPSLSPAAAFSALCGHRAGYSKEPEPRAKFQRGLVSLPTRGATCDTGAHLAGRASHLWNNWRHCLLALSRGRLRQTVSRCGCG